MRLDKQTEDMLKAKAERLKAENAELIATVQRLNAEIEIQRARVAELLAACKFVRAHECSEPCDECFERARNAIISVEGKQDARPLPHSG